MSNNLSFSFDKTKIQNIINDIKPNFIKIVDTIPIFDIQTINQIGTSNSSKEIIKDKEGNYMVSYELSIVFSNGQIPGTLVLQFQYFYPNSSSIDYNDFQLGTYLGNVVGNKSSGNFLNSNGVVNQIVEENNTNILFTVLFKEQKDELYLPLKRPVPGTYPWSGGEIKAVYLWESNFQTTNPVYYFSTVTQQQLSGGSGGTPQTESDGADSYLTNSSSTFTYSSDPSTIDPNVNSVFIFTGYVDVSNALSNSSTLYALNTIYLSSTTLLGLCLGGGNSNGEWYSGDTGGIYSVYQAVTELGVAFSYTETGTGALLTGTGTATLGPKTTSSCIYPYNALLFDMELTSGSTGYDFLNLFYYIKTNSNSLYYSSQSTCRSPSNPNIVIVVSISHSCSQNNGNGSVCVELQNGNSTGFSGCFYDYMSNQLYTQNVGEINEYVANYQILWTIASSNPSFVTSIEANPNYGIYGLNMILPSINLATLYKTGGSNAGNPPSLYYYQSTSNDAPAVCDDTGDDEPILDTNFPIDNGSVSFFQAMFASTSTLGGYIQWVNGKL